MKNKNDMYILFEYMRQKFHQLNERGFMYSHSEFEKVYEENILNMKKLSQKEIVKKTKALNIEPSKMKFEFEPYDEIFEIIYGFKYADEVNDNMIRLLISVDENNLLIIKRSVPKRNYDSLDTLSIYVYEDFIKRFGSLKDYCEYIYAAYLLKKSTLEIFIDELLEKFPNETTPYGMPDIKTYKQLKYKRLVLINYMFYIKNDDREICGKTNINLRDNDWRYKLPSISTLENYIENMLIDKKLDKQTVIKEHMDRILLKSKLLESNVEEKRGIVIQNTIMDYSKILENLPIRDMEYEHILNVLNISVKNAISYEI